MMMLYLITPMTLGKENEMVWIVLGVLVIIFGPTLLIRAAGYLVQKYRFGYSFKEVYKYHKEQDALERKTK